MVCNKLKILDGGVIKICPEINMPSKAQREYDLIQNFIGSNERTICRIVQDDDLNDRFIEVDNKWYVPPSRKYIAWSKKVYRDSTLFEGKIPSECYASSLDPHREMVLDYWSWTEVHDYLGIKPFIPSVMINISPDWEKDRWHESSKIRILSNIIESYLKEGWYSKASYVIENGSAGDHIHAHIVAEFKPDRVKSGCGGKKSHIGQSRHTTQLKKYGDKEKGMKGMIKGTGVQVTILRNEVLVKDKIDYLSEDLKPLGHKNLSIVMLKKDLVF